VGNFLVLLAGLHRFALASVHIFSILAGFGIYALTRWGNQIAVQLPVNIILYFLIMKVDPPNREREIPERNQLS
jgi:hypothetical protein